MEAAWERGHTHVHVHIHGQQWVGGKSYWINSGQWPAHQWKRLVTKKSGGACKLAGACG